jgi:SMODS and SLOG-associating 2TM effector domain family 4
MTNANIQTVRESFARVVYSHKTHEKACEISNNRATLIKWVNIILTAITASSIIGVIITDQEILKYVTAVVATITLGFAIFQLSFNPQEDAAQHKQAANELWYIRDKYLNLLTDMMNNTLTEAQIINKRDGLLEELKLIYRFAPPTNTRAYKKAQRALKIQEEMTFTNDEINNFLPKELWIK